MQTLVHAPANEMGSAATGQEAVDYYFVKTSSSRYVGMYSAHDIQEGLATGKFMPDWLAVKNSGSISHPETHSQVQGAWSPLVTLFGTPNIKDPVSIPIVLPPPAPEAPLTEDANRLVAPASSKWGLKSKCKKCGAVKSIFKPLCDPCEKEAKAARLLAAQKLAEDKKRLELERKAKTLEVATQNMDLIIKAITPETPLGYMFIHRNVTQKSGGNNSGVLVGGLLGGVVGAMIGGALTSGGSGGISGELGIVVVTSTQVIIHSFNAPFPSVNGNIGPNHLSLILQQLKAKAIKGMIFNIRQTQLAPLKEANTSIRLLSGLQDYSFQKSELYVNDGIFPLPSVNEIKKMVEAGGVLITPTAFIEQLLRRENPISDEQLSEIKGDEKYFAQLFTSILNHPKRDTLQANFEILGPLTREVLEARFKAMASTYNRARTKLIAWLIIAGAAMIGIFKAADFLLFISWVVALTMAGWSIRDGIKLRKILWCRRTFLPKEKQI